MRNEIENEAETGNGEIATITPTTNVRLNLRTVITILVVIMSVIAAAIGGYNTLTNNTTILEAKQLQLEKRLEASATKADLRELRYQMREDLLNSIWLCSKDATSGGLSCQLRLSNSSTFEP